MYGLSGRELRFALVISSSHFTQHVYYRVLPPLIPVLSVALEYPLWQLGLLITIYSLGMGVVQAPLGVLSDRIDRRYMLPTGISITAAAYLLFALAPTLGGAIPTASLFGHFFEGGFLVMSLAMVVVGVGLAVVHPVGYPMITDNVSPDNKGKVLGVFGAASKFGDGATPALIAGLILLLAWEQIILLFGVAGLLYGAALYAVLRSDEYETVPSGRRVESDVDEDDETGSGPLDGDRRSYQYPMAVIYLFFINSGLTSRGLSTFLPAYLVAVYAYSFDAMGIHAGAESVANVYFALLLFAGATTQLYLGGLTDAHDPRLVLVGCMAVATAGMVSLALFDLSPLALLAVIVVLGAGMYGVNPARDALISDISPPEFEGRTFGFIFTAAGLTTAIFPTIVGYLLEVLGMREGFLALAVGTVLAGASIGLLYSQRVYLADEGVRMEPSD